jgi:hypothetical protein
MATKESGPWCPYKEGLNHTKIRTPICSGCGIRLHNASESFSNTIPLSRGGKKQPISIPEGTTVHLIGDSPERLPSVSQALHLSAKASENPSTRIDSSQARIEAEKSRQNSIQQQSSGRIGTEKGINAWKCTIQIHAYLCRYVVRDVELDTRRWMQPESIRNYVFLLAQIT